MAKATPVGATPTGKEEDVEVGLTYFGARYYHARLGRWMSPDPLTVHGLGADLNPYAYVGGNVLGAVDPWGLDDGPEIIDIEVKGERPKRDAPKRDAAERGADLAGHAKEGTKQAVQHAVGHHPVGGAIRLIDVVRQLAKEKPTPKQLATGVIEAKLRSWTTPTIIKVLVKRTTSLSVEKPATAGAPGAKSGEIIEGMITDGAMNALGGVGAELAAEARAASAVAKASPFSFHRLHALLGRAAARRVAAIAKSMKAEGYRGPPVKVFEHGGEKYVLDGHHRLAAARQAGLTDVPFESVPLEQLPQYGYADADAVLRAASEAFGR